jgi:thiol:disulfide interchange protein DsbD
MGAAVGYALLEPPWVSFVIFTALAMGMAAPYLLLSSVPALVSALPKPGRWMDVLRKIMAVPLFGTVMWLFWVLRMQIGNRAFVSFLPVAVLAAVSAWLYGSWANPARPRSVRRIASLGALSLLAAGMAFSFVSIRHTIGTDSRGAQPRASGELPWETYSVESVQELRGLGRPVFIDFTAAWCLTCQVNERVTFRAKEVQEKFVEHGVALLKADWTSKDRRILEALQSYGRNGVPVYVLYRPHEAEPELLPELLTPSLVTRALDKIRK